MMESPRLHVAALQAKMCDLRERASFFRSMRRKDVELYTLLGECLALCEQAERENLTDDLRREYLAATREDGRNRRYFEGAADIYLIVGRAVFESQANRAACWRYTATLREAAKHQIDSTGLAEWLRSNGGVNALFRTRPVQARIATTRTLHLNQSVTIPKDQTFTLTLARDSRGFFDVIAEQTQ